MNNAAPVAPNNKSRQSLYVVLLLARQYAFYTGVLVEKPMKNDNDKKNGNGNNRSKLKKRADTSSNTHPDTKIRFILE